MDSGPNTFIGPSECSNPQTPDTRALDNTRVEGGFPHSEILGSKLVRSSPRLIAAYHVLHRLSAPRHPPNALKALDRSHDRCPPALGEPSNPYTKGRTIRKTCLRISPKTHFACQRIRLRAPQRLRGCRREAGAPALRPRMRPSSRCQTPERRRHRSAHEPIKDLEAAPPMTGADPAAATGADPAWWSQTGSNRRPHACKARALPTELWPLVTQGQMSERRRNCRRLRIGRPALNGGPGTTRTSDLTLIRGAL